MSADEATQEDVDRRLRGRGPNVKERVTVRLPSDLLERADELVEDGTYPNRSELVRDALRREVERGEMADKRLWADVGGESDGE